MKSLKTVLLSTAVLAGFGLFLGGKDAFADEQYTVQSGDTLSTIATNFYGYSSDDTINAIVEANEIADKNLIFVGEALIIPTDGTATHTESANTTAAASVQQPSEPAASQSSNTQSAAASTQSSSSYSSSASGSEASAKEWIANKESGGSYTATNGQYYGRYQLTNSYLNGDYSAANQEKVADEYVASRYGSWSAAKAFWEANGWY